MVGNLKIVLWQPLFPHNAGAVVRLASVVGAQVWFVGKVAFSLGDRAFKRGALDYWKYVDIRFVENFDFLEKSALSEVAFFSAKASQSWNDVDWKKLRWLVFGNEVYGLPEVMHRKYQERFIKLPMLTTARCLNLATSVSAAVYRWVYEMGY